MIGCPWDILSCDLIVWNYCLTTQEVDWMPSMQKVWRKSPRLLTCLPKRCQRCDIQQRQWSWSWHEEVLGLDPEELGKTLVQLPAVRVRGSHQGTVCVCMRLVLQGHSRWSVCIQRRAWVYRSPPAIYKLTQAKKHQWSLVTRMRGVSPLPFPLSRSPPKCPQTNMTLFFGLNVCCLAVVLKLRN